MEASQRKDGLVSFPGYRKEFRLWSIMDKGMEIEHVDGMEGVLSVGGGYF